ncbi:MFS transporter [Falsibacillus albus]|uniref:MFS transporter n=1 Tax=Falsibacillus albus TaxID=2478915 RepID=A0A3L7JUI3_9BACI|nr:MFS transporter [Falsibacillus albus]RLQ94528.1 MFS transporter [Falsibacillus albus]
MKNTWNIYMLTLISFFVGTSQFGIVGMLDKIADSVDVSIPTAGQLVTAFALANAIGTPIMMIAIAKMNQRKQLLLALIIIIIGIISTITLPGFGLLMAARVVMGVGTGMFIVTAYNIASKLAAPGKRGGAMSNISMGFSSSLVFGVPLGRVIAASYDWKTIFWIIGIFCSLALFAVARTIPNMEGEGGIPLGKRLTLLKNPLLAVTLSVTLLVFIGFSIIDTYITPYLSAVIPPKIEISFILFAMGIASVIGSKTGGLFADRIGAFRTLMGSMFIQVLAMALLSFGSGSTIVTIILLMLWEIACWTFGAVQNFNLVSIAPESSGIVLSLNSSFVQLGFALGAGIGGMAVGGFSIMAITYISAAFVLCAAAIFIVRYHLSNN